MLSLTYTAEQSILDETLTTLLANCQHEVTSKPDCREGIWQKLIELGLCAMPFSEDDGGLGSSSADQMVVQRAIGRTAIDLPFMSNSIICGSILAGSMKNRAAIELAHSVIEGDAVISFAHYELADRSQPNSITTSAVAIDEGFQLWGVKSKVLHADLATHFIVSASVRPGASPWLFLVRAEQPGVSIVSNGGRTGTWACNVRFDGIVVSAREILAASNDARDLTELALDGALVATVHEEIGAMEKLHQITVDYLKLRKQFGTPIGTFQVLQHKAVDMYVELEQARSLAIYANALLSADPASRHAAAVAAKMQVNKAARFVGETSIQLHGAIGLTMESEAGRLFRRLTALQLLFADTDQCQAELSRTNVSVLDD